MDSYVGEKALDEVMTLLLPLWHFCIGRVTMKTNIKRRKTT